MFTAIEKITREKVTIDEVLQEAKEKEYICPICEGPLIIKNGHVNAAHFAHKAIIDCDSFTSDISIWHKNWQKLFPKGNQEVVLKLDISEEDYEEAGKHYGFVKNNDTELDEESKKRIKHIKHRADVLACGYAIEFRHSSISCREFNERNWFYRKCGYRVVWIFDFREAYKCNRIKAKDPWKKDKGRYLWKHAPKTFRDFLPQEHTSKKENGEWEKGDVTLIFQLRDKDQMIERLLWVPVGDDGLPSYKKHFTTSFYPHDEKEFVDWIKKRKL